MAGFRRLSTIFSFLAIALIGLACVFLAFIDLKPEQAPAAAAAQAAPTATQAAPQATPTPVSTPTLTPSWLEQRAGQVNENVKLVEEQVVQPAWNVLKLVGLALTLLLALWLIARLVNELWGRIFGLPLVFDPISNATGDEQLDKVLTGLGFKARQALLRDAQSIKKVLKEEAPRILNFDPEEDSTFGSIAKEADTRLADIITAAKDFAPASIKPLLGLVAILFQQRGVRVSAILTWEQKHPPRRAIELELVDSREHFQPILQTISEPGPGNAAPAQASPVGLSAPQADHLHRSGQALMKAGQLPDAAALFQAVLKIDPAYPQAAEDLAACLASSKVQGAAQAAYTLGGQLVEAGLLDQAAERYADGVLPPRRAEALQAWKVVLSETNKMGKKAVAWHRLAGLTREVFLAAEAVKLYKSAAGAGNDQAQADLEAWYAQEAIHLADAAESLLEVGRFASARKYLDLALARAPGSPRVTALLARLSQLSPHGELEQHAQEMQLARFYLKNGMLDKAKEQAETALKALPADPQVQELLQQIVNEEAGGIDRYAGLIPLAARFITLEVMHQELLHDFVKKTRPNSGVKKKAGKKPAKKLRDLLQGPGLFKPLVVQPEVGPVSPVPTLDEVRENVKAGKVEYLTGVLYGNALWGIGAEPGLRPEFYYTQAVSHLQKAANLWQGAWQPHSALGDVHTMAAHKGICPEEPATSYRRACDAYLVAERWAAQAEFADRHTPLLGLALMLLRRNGPGDIDLAREKMNGLLAENQAKVALQKPRAFAYNLACWLSLACAELQKTQNDADRQQIDAYFGRARYLLAAILLRDREEKRYWAYMETDSDLDFVRGDLSGVKRELQTDPGSYAFDEKETSPERFDQMVQKLVKAAGYLFAYEEAKQ